MHKQYHGENPFMQIEDWVVDILSSEQLTKTDHRLFWYLFKLERWGDRFVELPSQAEIAHELGVRRETINSSQAKLQKLGLWDFKVSRWQAKNLVGPKANKVLNFPHQLLEKPHTTTPETNPDATQESNLVLEESISVLEKSHTQLKQTSPDATESNSVLEKSHSNIYVDRAPDQSLQNKTDRLQTEAECPTAATELLKVVVDATCDDASPLELLNEQPKLPGRQISQTHTHPIPAPLEQLQPLGKKETELDIDNFSAPGIDPEIQRSIQRMAFDWRSCPWMSNATEFQPVIKAAVWRSNPQEYSIAGTDVPNETYIINHLRKLQSRLKNPTDAYSAYVKLQTYWKTAQALTNPKIQSEFSQLKVAAKQAAIQSQLEQRKQHTLEAIKDLI
jgi:hypothetical protein